MSQEQNFDRLKTSFFGLPESEQAIATNLAARKLVELIESGLQEDVGYFGVEVSPGLEVDVPYAFKIGKSTEEEV